MHRQSHTVLIVSDSHPASGLRPTFLVHPSIRLIDSPDEDRALVLAHDARPELIIDEIQGPEEDAFRLCRRLRESSTTRSIPVIVVADAGLKSRAEASGANVLVQTPIIQREYFEAVSRFVPMPERRVLRHPINLRFSYSYQGRLAQAFSRDVSLYGAFLKTDRPIEQGSHIEVRFCIPGDDRPICCGAVVRRTMPLGQHPARCAGFGIEFEGIDEIELRRIQHFIERQLGASVFAR